MKKITMVFLLTVITVFASGIIAFAAVNVQNAGFEQSQSGKADFWSQTVWHSEKGVTTFGVDKKIKHSGKSSGFIENKSVNDARYKQTVKLESNKYYKLTCWVKTENVGKKASGANISIEGILDASKSITGTSETWKQVVMYGKTAENQTEIILTVGLGGYGSENTGKAWFDDVKVEKLDKLPNGVVAAPLQKNDNPDKDETKSTGNMGYIFLIAIVAVLIVVVIISYVNYSKKKSIDLTENVESEEETEEVNEEEKEEEVTEEPKKESKRKSKKDSKEAEKEEEIKEETKKKRKKKDEE